MKRTFLAVLALTVGLANAAPSPAYALSDDEKKALAIALALGLGVAAAKHGATYNSGNQWDEDLYGQPFSPSANVVCAPKPRKCYKNGHVSYQWTKRIFG